MSDAPFPLRVRRLESSDDKSRGQSLDFATAVEQPEATDKLIARERARLTGLCRKLGVVIDQEAASLGTAGLVCLTDAEGSAWAWSYDPADPRMGSAALWAHRRKAVSLKLIRPKDALEGELGVAALCSMLNFETAGYLVDGVDLVLLEGETIDRVVRDAPPLRPLDWPLWRDALQGRAHQAALVLDGIVERHNQQITDQRAELVFGPDSDGGPALWCWGVEVVSIDVAADEDGLVLDVGVGEHDRSARRDLIGQSSLGPEHTLAVEAELGELANLVAELRPLNGTHPLSRLRSETRLLDEVRRSGAVDGRALSGQFEWLSPPRTGRGLLERGAAFAQAGDDLLVGTARGDLEIVADLALAWIRFLAAGHDSPRVEVLVAPGDAHGFITEGLALLAPQVPATLHRVVPEGGEVAETGDAANDDES